MLCGDCSGTFQLVKTGRKYHHYRCPHCGATWKQLTVKELLKNHERDMKRNEAWAKFCGAC